jgi:hypothetical protein
MRKQRQQQGDRESLCQPNQHYQDQQRGNAPVQKPTDVFEEKKVKLHGVCVRDIGEIGYL